MKKNDIKKVEDKKRLLFILAFFLFSVASSVFGILYLSEVKKPFFEQNVIRGCYDHYLSRFRDFSVKR